MAEVHTGLRSEIRPAAIRRPQRARRLLEEARDEVATFLGRDPGDIVFTSGGTEAANLAVLRDGRGGPVRAAVRRCCCARPWSTPRCSVGPGRGARRCGLPRPARRPCRSARPRRSGPNRYVAQHARGRDDGQQRDRGRAATGRCRRRRAAPRPAGVRVHRRGAGRAVPRPGRGRRRRRPGVAQRPQGRWAGRRRCAGGGPASGPGGAPARWRAGARAAQRHPGRGGCGRARHRVATGRGRARRRGRRVAALRDRLGRRAACVGAGRAAGRCPTTSPSCPDTCTCACPGSSARSCWSPSARKGCACRAARRVPAVPSSRATSSSAMGVAPELAAGAVRFTLGYGTTDADVDRALAVVPGVVDALRRRA